MPFVVFVHGLGMSHRVWTSPHEEKVFFGNASLEVLVNPEPPEQLSSTFVLGKTKKRLYSPFHVLAEKGFNLLAYSQSRPSAGTGVLVDELHEVLQTYEELTRKGTIFVCHSRGGLIFRAYLQKYSPSYPVISFFSLASPHKGSNLARVAKKIDTLLSPLKGFFKESQNTDAFRTIITRLVLFLSSEGIKELLPGSDFIKSLDEYYLRRVPTYCFSGTNPRLLIIYRWNKNCFSYQEMMKLPDFLTSKTQKIWPEELLAGKGDGLVSVESAKVKMARAIYYHDCNHAEIIYEPVVHRQILDVLEEKV